jgi:hypothetical protein
VIPIHDVSQGRRVPHDSIRATLDRALLEHGLPSGGNRADARYDADGYVGYAGAGVLENWQSRADEALSDELHRRGWTPGPRLLDFQARNDAENRADDLGIGSPAFPREFEFIRTRILEEVRQPLTADLYFPADTSVPLGARSHSQRRVLGTGEAQIYRGGSEIPVVGHSYIREQFGVAYVVSSVATNFFTMLTTDFAGLQAYQQDLSMAFRVVNEKMDEIFWYGDPASQIYGILNYPSLQKYVLATSLADTSTPAAVVSQIVDFVNHQMVASVGTFAPNALLVSPKIKAYITSRWTTLAMSMTIEEAVLKALSGVITRIDVSPRLAGCGPSSTDGLLAYRNEPDSVAQVRIQAPTTMPIFQASPFDQTTVVFGCTGGATSFQTGNCLLGYATVQSI